jgi:hypothetical protein
MRCQNLPNALRRDRDARTHQRKPYRQCGDGFGFAVAKGMIFIARLNGVL